MSDEVRESVAAYGAPLRRWTVRDYYRAASRGVFGDDEKLELLRGEVVRLSPQKSPHAAATSRLRLSLETVFPGAVIREHSPMYLDDHNEPEPDVLVARGPIDQYDARHPNASDALLVVEVADSSIRKDRKLKGPLYAEFGIREYWILDLKANRLEIYRDPAQEINAKWGYSSTQLLETDATVAPIHGNGQSVTIASIIPG